MDGEVSENVVYQPALKKFQFCGRMGNLPEPPGPLSNAVDLISVTGAAHNLFEVGRTQSCTDRDTVNNQCDTSFNMRYVSA